MTIIYVISTTNTLAYKIVQAFPQGLHVAHSDILKPVFLWCDRWLDSVFKIDEYYFTIFLNYRTHVNCHDTQRIIMFVERFVREYGLWSLILFVLLSMLQAKAFMFRVLYM